MRVLILAGFFVAAPFVAAAAAPSVDPAPAPSAAPSLAPLASDPWSALRAAHDRARDAAYGALSTDHARAVRAIVAEADAGTIDRERAARRIDALLTEDERGRVLQADAGFRTAMRAGYVDVRPGGSPPGGAGDPPGPPPGSAIVLGRSHGPGFRSGEGLAAPPNFTPDAGRALLMLGSNARRSTRDRRDSTPSGASSAP